MRAVNDAKWGYMYHPWADGKRRLRTHGHGSLTFQEMVALSSSDQDMAKRVNFSLYRSREEFYDYEKDPQAMHNLAGKQEYSEMQAAYRSKLLAHMIKTRDPLLDRFKEYVTLNPV